MIKKRHLATLVCAASFRTTAFSPKGYCHVFGLTRLANRLQSTELFMKTASSCASRYFQLEEMEDKDSCLTEIFLRPDKSIALGETDGPGPLASSGSWERTDDGGIKMTIKRRFKAGQNATQVTDIGEFTYDVDRVYTGRAETVGDLLSFQGAIHNLDEAVGDMEVGFFEMIDTTDSKSGKEREVL